MQSFAVPANPDDLLQRSSDAHITVQHLSDLADLSADAAQDLADGVNCSRGCYKVCSTLLRVV